jgi:hypothetical protein
LITIDPSWTDITSAVAAAGTVVVAAIAGLFAARQLSEARRLRRAQVRPFVVIDFDAQSDPPLIFVEITNLGTTMARQVTFDFDYPLETSFDAKGEIRVADLGVFTQGIPNLPPGKRIHFLFDSFLEREGLRDTYQVTVSYEGEALRRWPRKAKRERWVEPITLDLGLYRKMLRVTRHGLHDIHERLKEIETELQKWSASGGRGLLRLSPDEVRARDDAWMQAQREADERRADESKGEGGSDKG